MPCSYLHSYKCISLASIKTQHFFAGEPSLGDYFDPGFVGDDFCCLFNQFGFKIKVVVVVMEGMPS
jgi:hypothetical protein